MSPGFASALTFNASICSSVKNFKIGDFTVPSSMYVIQAIPFAPKEIASERTSSISFLEYPAMPGILIAFAIPPFFKVSLTGSNVDSIIMSEISNNSKPKRASGLSEPNLSIASCQLILVKGGLISTPAALNASTIKPSVSSITSS